MQKLIIPLLLILFASCSRHRPASGLDSLRFKLESIADTASGTVGIAFISGSDTLTVNNSMRYPMMSVFKLHQSLAAAHALESHGESFNKLLHIQAESLSRDTWSPMLKDHSENEFDISVGDLVHYAISQSDNNASNLIFKHIAGPEATDQFVKSIAPDTTFAIRYTEEQMANNHTLCYENYSSPFSCASLIKRVFEHNVVAEENLSTIHDALRGTTTGSDRLPAPVAALKGASVAHKTGSGYRSETGALMAFNDIAYITLPNGTDYALAVMIRDFNGSENEAAQIMARISEAVLDYLLK